MSAHSEILKYQKEIVKTRALLSKAETILTGEELEYIHESAMLKAFRGFESVTESVFLHCMNRNVVMKFGKLDSHIKASSPQHALQILCLERPFIDWDKPQNVIKRAEVIFKNGSKLSQFFKSNNEKLLEARKIRNFIAHQSAESERSFGTVYQRYFGTFPSGRMSPGKLLKQNLPNSKNPISFTNYYVNVLESICGFLV